MYELLIHTPPLVAIAVFFLLSLIGAIVLFHFLKSTGVFSTVKGQAGGALAGFLMIFAAMQGSYLALAPSGPEQWTIQGAVQGTDGNVPIGVEILVLPPEPRDLVDQPRDFKLENVEIRDGVWPQLQFSAADYYPDDVILSPEDLKIYPERKLAIIKEPILLEPSAPDTVETAELSQ